MRTLCLVVVLIGFLANAGAAEAIEKDHCMHKGKCQDEAFLEFDNIGETITCYDTCQVSPTYSVLLLIPPPAQFRFVILKYKLQK